MNNYSIWDPTGNITALVEGDVTTDLQPSYAAAIMARHPEVEQVGFVRFPAKKDLPAVILRMAGGEFCGNASMCAAALYAMKTDEKIRSVILSVSGCTEPVTVKLDGQNGEFLRSEIDMPPAVSVLSTKFSFGGMTGLLPVVKMEGISHIIVEPGSAFSSLIKDRPGASAAVKEWCRILSADGLGLIFLEKDGAGSDRFLLTPLVYIPAGDTLFWENSCASGTAAAGTVLAKRHKEPVRFLFKEPGGTLSVCCDPASNKTRLFAGVRLLSAGHAAALQE